MLEYWYSDAAGCYIVAHKETGELLGQFDDVDEITYYFMPEIVTHNEEQCDAANAK